MLTEAMSRTKVTAANRTGSAARLPRNRSCSGMMRSFIWSAIGNGSPPDRVRTALSSAAARSVVTFRSSSLADDVEQERRRPRLPRGSTIERIAVDRYRPELRLQRLGS